MRMQQCELETNGVCLQTSMKTAATHGDVSICKLCQISLLQLLTASRLSRRVKSRKKNQKSQDEQRLLHDAEVEGMSRRRNEMLIFNSSYRDYLKQTWLGAALFVDEHIETRNATRCGAAPNDERLGSWTRAPKNTTTKTNATRQKLGARPRCAFCRFARPSQRSYCSVASAARLQKAHSCIKAAECRSKTLLAAKNRL